MTSYILNEHETLTVRSREGDVVDVLARYDAGEPPPLHWHPNQSEHFEVLEGTLTVILAGERTTVRAGESITIPAGVTHCMWNCDQSQAVAIWRTTPAGRTEQWFARLAAVNQGGHANILEFAVAAQEFRDVFRLGIKPTFVATVLVATLAFVGRMRSRLSRRPGSAAGSVAASGSGASESSAVGLEPPVPTERDV